MTKHTQAAFARDLAEQMIRERFSATYGVETFDAYLDLIDLRQTQHLSPGLADRVAATAGKQRRSIRLWLEDAVTVMARVPMNDPRRDGAQVWAEIEFAAWLDMIENGADGAWVLNYADKNDSRCYVRTCPPLSRSGTCNLVTVGRLVANAGRGRSVRFRDRNPLNLRRTNLFIVGHPPTGESPTKGPKHDARALVANGAALRQSLAGADFDIPPADDEGHK